MMIHVYIGQGSIYILLIIYESRLFRPALILRSLHPLRGYICLCVCPPLPRAADGGLYHGRSAGYFIPRPPAVQRLDRVARERVASSPHPCHTPAAAPPPICPQRGRPDFKLRWFLNLFFVFYIQLHPLGDTHAGQTKKVDDKSSTYLLLLIRHSIDFNVMSRAEMFNLVVYINLV